MTERQKRLDEMERERMHNRLGSGHVRPEVRDEEHERFYVLSKAATQEAGGGHWE